MSKFYVRSYYGEILDIALTLQDVEGHEVVFDVVDRKHHRIGDGMVKKDSKWWDYANGEWVFIIDSCEEADFSDHLRHHRLGVPVFGTTVLAAEYESDRQAGQRLFREAGYYQPKSANFHDFDSALDFVTKNPGKVWVFKQNGTAPKSINHMGKFDGGEDMIFHIQSLKKRWTETAFGPIDFDLMEKVTGLECAASAYFNSSDYMRDERGDVACFLNFEEKKEATGGMGETCGEMGTLFYGTTTGRSRLAANILLRPALVDALASAGMRGVVDFNCILTKDGLVGLEPTCRIGIPTASYIHCVATQDIGRVFSACARGHKEPVTVTPGFGMVMVVASKPFPAEPDLMFVDDEATSIGEKLWILNGKGKPQKDFTFEQRQRIHPENFYKDDEGNYKVATKDGYLLTVTGQGHSIHTVRDELIQYINDNLYISGMKYRVDIGSRVEDYPGLSGLL